MSAPRMKDRRNRRQRGTDGQTTTATGGGGPVYDRKKEVLLPDGRRDGIAVEWDFIIVPRKAA